MNNLFDDIKAENEKLNKIEFGVKGNRHTFHFTQMTYYEKQRIINKSTKTITKIDVQKNKTVMEEIQDDLIPIYTIIEMAKDKDGKKLYSLTNKEHFDIISKFEWNLLSYIAATIGLKPIGQVVEEQQAILAKMKN